jgi:2,4-dienoyl-CoA reductase-like NADH-dependent reductase (Old Yellow Enzyme family)
MQVSLDMPLTLPCGTVLRNRIAKAAMTEGLGDAQGRPTDRHVNLYRAWAQSGAGLLLTGNVMIDADHLERPGNVVIARDADEDMRSRLTAWSKAGTANGTQLWMQISHPGRQTPALVNPHPKAPSAVALGLPGKQFGTPVAMTAQEVEAVVAGFVRVARVARDTGFTGVQIHAAHGYLISQFLSPRANRRTDEWGGSLENRARLLLEIVNRTRAAVGPAFPISVKLNSADFQKGGFAFEDSLAVARWLQGAGIDLIEVSGGTYEQPKMMDLDGLEPPETPKVAVIPELREPEPSNVRRASVSSGTAAREAYFVDFAKAMRAELGIPVMLTGGIRSRRAIDHALANDAADIVGLARPMCVDTDAPRRLTDGGAELPRWEGQLKMFPNWLSFLRKIAIARAVEGFAILYWYYAQLYRLGDGKAVDRTLSVFAALREVETTHRLLARQRRR